jgi:hypothetical protein
MRSRCWKKNFFKSQKSKFKIQKRVASCLEWIGDSKVKSQNSKFKKALLGIRIGNSKFKIQKRTDDSRIYNSKKSLDSSNGRTSYNAFLNFEF